MNELTLVVDTKDGLPNKYNRWACSRESIEFVHVLHMRREYHYGILVLHVDVHVYVNTAVWRLDVIMKKCHAIT